MEYMLQKSHLEESPFGTSCGQPHQVDKSRGDFCTGISLKPLHFVSNGGTGTVGEVKGPGFAEVESLMWMSKFES